MSPVTRCYGGALVRYTDAGRTVTVVGSADFMTNAGLLKRGQRRAGDESGGRHAAGGLVCTAAQSRANHRARQRSST